MRRREFLQALGATGAAAALSPLSAISLEDDWYVNSRIGLTLRKPLGWHFISVVDFERLMDKQQDEFEEDRDLLRKLREGSSQPILVVTKYDPIPDDGVCPTIQIHATPPEPDPPKHHLFLSAIGAHSGLRGMLRDYRPEGFPDEEELAGHKAFSWNYTYRLGPGEGELVRTRATLVDGSFADFSIGMAGPAQGPDRSDEVFDAVKESIEIG